MSNQNPKINNSSFEDRPSRPVRPSFREAFRRAAQQVELNCSDIGEKDALRELCYIIAEVYIIDPDSKVKISDEILDAYLVQEIFGELTLEHLRLVHSNFHDQTDLVKNKRAYLRTALYNSVFEINAHYTNLVKHDLGIWKWGVYIANAVIIAATIWR